MPRLFFSGSPDDKTDRDPRIPRTETWYRLGSCHEATVNAAFKRGEITVAETGGNCELLFDSGAFTAWSKGREVDLDALCAVYDKALEQFATRCKAVWLINLDKIPGEKGRGANAAELLQAMEISNVNFARMRLRYGEHVIPVFHQDEPFSQLRTLAQESSYVCISPRNDLPEKQRVKWSIIAHDIVDGKCHTHGLAATGMVMMRHVPWTSVDSAAWVFMGANGGVMLPDGSVLGFSDQSPMLKQQDQHYRTLSDVARKAVEDIVASYGFTVDELEKDSTSRITFNRISFMRNAARAYDDVRTRVEKGGLFGA